MRIRTSCIMLSAVLFLCGCAAQQAQQGPLNVKTSLWEYRGTTDHEKQSPGMGKSSKYVAPFGWADVYEYDLGRKDWREGTDDAAFETHFKGVLADVFAMEKQGRYRGVTIVALDDELISGLRFRHAVLRYEADGTPIESHIYLAGFKGHVVRFRISLWSPVEEGTKKMVTDFLGDLVKAMVTGRSA